jgi:hypothetical protein
MQELQNLKGDDTTSEVEFQYKNSENAKKLKMFFRTFQAQEITISLFSGTSQQKRREFYIIRG